MRGSREQIHGNRKHKPFRRLVGYIAQTLVPGLCFRTLTETTVAFSNDFHHQCSTGSWFGQPPIFCIYRQLDSGDRAKRRVRSTFGDERVTQLQSDFS